MTFDEIRTRVCGVLQRQRRVSYQVLKRRFDLDGTYQEGHKVEIIQVQRLAIDETGAALSIAATPWHVDNSLAAWRSRVAK